ncbi:PIN-like domain-containing protein [Micromonospora sp. NBC_00821]|uniref:PIN-like domain-containing protein n=1 Tax=Micromonospora sp. NBC_00821 TaxID=2975977 RepID=UPI002ED4DC37|nr:PIN-like domain-containing protein [Micromonospora sp. NBC_00821]
MSDSVDIPDLNNLGLHQAFRAWVGPDLAASFLDGLVVLDANTLLHLYRVTRAAREQVLSTLARVEERLWVPHQAAVEFHRNRLEVVNGKMARFKEMRSTLSQASSDAVSNLRKSVIRLVEFRQYNMADRDWDPQEHGLDEESIQKRLDGLMDSALAELKALQDEHDIRPGDVAIEDPVLQRLDVITRGKLGRPYSQRHLMEIVGEAIDFRFPNEIPPGYKDAEKKSPYRAAGDYVLWRQVLDRASEEPRHGLIVLVTNDVKSDWWILDKNGEPIEARPELRQEMFECTGAQLRLLTLSGFLKAAADQFPGSVSDETVRSVRRSETMTRIAETVSVLRATDRDLFDSDLLSLPPFMFEQLVLALLIAMGYQDVDSIADGLAPGPSIRATHPHSTSGDGTILVKVEHYSEPVGGEAIRALKDAMLKYAAESGIVVTTSEFSQAAQEAIVDCDIQLIGGRRLIRLLHEFLGIVFTISTLEDEK